MSVITWLEPHDCDPPHGLDMQCEHDAAKVAMLADAFYKSGFDDTKSALVGYVKNGRVQLLSGTHRHRAALYTQTPLPVVLWLGSDIDKAWGQTEQWMRIIQDIPVRELETWTREQIDVNTLVPLKPGFWKCPSCGETYFLATGYETGHVCGLWQRYQK